MLTRTKESTTAQVRAASATAVAIALAKRPSIYVPLSKLIAGQHNVRNANSREAKDVAELAELIYSQSLLSALHVVPQLINGRESGSYEVVAGGRRLRALQLLAAQKRIAEDEEVECKVVTRDACTEVSTAENSGREDLHAADTILAFKKMADEGRAVEEIASRFGVRVKLVKQRLRLAHVAPKLLDLFRAGNATLDQMQALAISDDQEHQVAVWESLEACQRYPQTLRRRLLCDEIRLTDGRVRFVGLQAYKARGGTTRADLFSPGEQTFITDVPLLDLMLAEKLERAAQEVRLEGWRWVEVRERFDYSDRAAYSRLRPTSRPATTDEAQAIARAQKALEEATAAKEAYECNDEGYFFQKAQRLEREVEVAADVLSKIEEGRAVWTNEHKNVSGVVVTLNDGALAVHRGLVRAEDRKAARTMDPATPDDKGSQKKERPEVPEKLMLSLTSQRTMALQAALLGNQHVALATLAYSLIASMRMPGAQHVAQVRMKECRFRIESLAPAAKDSRAARELDAAGEQWDRELPDENLYAWLRAQPLGKLLELLTWCTANSLDAIGSHSDNPRGQANELTLALDMDMADWWTATPETYLASVPKAKLIEAVVEAAGAEAAQPIGAMKKEEAVAAAAQLLRPTRWLPKPLRRVQCEDATSE